jgi:hypothetical protein
MLLPPFHRTKSDFLGEATPALRDKTAKLAKSSETSVQKNSLRGCDLPASQRNKWCQPPKTVQKDHTNEGTYSDPDRVSHARPLKVTIAKGF